ncbi:MAG: Flp family type IVb pilin [Nitrolancea sp.]
MSQYLKAIYGLYMPNENFEGQGMVEYALILVLVSVVAMAVLFTVGGQVTSVFQQISDRLGGSSAS